jgi:hypothetical protein
MKPFPEKLPPEFFEDETFAIGYRDYINLYVEGRILGRPDGKMFRDVFGKANFEDDDRTERVLALERNPYYKERFKKRLHEVKVADMWNTKVALNELLNIMHDIFTKDAVRLSAIKELNLLCGITVVDEAGKTRAGRTLSDFYKNEGIMPTLDEDDEPSTQEG